MRTSNFAVRIWQKDLFHTMRIIICSIYIVIRLGIHFKDNYYIFRGDNKRKKIAFRKKEHKLENGSLGFIETLHKQY